MGLAREPFVSGANLMIDRATAQIPNAHQDFLAVFSSTYFPDAQIVLEGFRKEGGSDVYRWPEQQMEGWLCAALLKSFEGVTEKMYVEVKAVG